MQISSYLCNTSCIESGLITYKGLVCCLPGYHSNNELGLGVHKEKLETVDSGIGSSVVGKNWNVCVNEHMPFSPASDGNCGRFIFWIQWVVSMEILLTKQFHKQNQENEWYEGITDQRWDRTSPDQRQEEMGQATNLYELWGEKLTF